MKKILLYSMLVAAATSFLSARAEGELKIVALDATGNVISEEIVPTDGSLSFSSSGVNLRDAETLPVAKFDFAGLNMLTFEYTSGAGVEEVRAANHLRLAHNPVSENLEIIGFTGSVVPVKVYDSKGALRVVVKEWKGGNIDVSTLAPGLYFVTVNKTPIKFIKK